MNTPPTLADAQAKPDSGPHGSPGASAAAAVTHPGPLPESGFGTTGFGSTSFGATGFGTVAVPAPVASSSLFDVCHVGTVLRATLFVHGVLAIGVLFVATGPVPWLWQMAGGIAIALPATLIWLLVTCALRQKLAARRPVAQGLAVGVLGAACGAAGWALSSLAFLVGSADADHTGPLGPIAAGAALALLMHQWLRMRALARTPADTAARLAELQSRIRPHFLFNTLNSALALVRHDPQRAEQVLEDLAELFRVALTEAGGSASLADEIALAQRYLDIEKIRFGDRLVVTWDLDPQADAARLPPLLLQPLVENAVRHGVEPSAEGGVIRVRTQLRGGRAVLSITNSVSAATSTPGHGMALRNVQERLLLMHDVTGQFQARRDGDTFRVQIAVPL
jgi:two-component system sensor histidine kinase AlgZ